MKNTILEAALKPFMSIQALETLKEYFGFSSFRPMQQEVVEAALAGHDVLALMPTGGGKSICYQVPALCKDGLCLVISPLIALMNDQIQHLRKKSITAFAIHSGMRRKDIIQVLETAARSNCKFLYVSPERLETVLFKEYLPALHVNFIAVDEAHCISQWGYDFRPPYLRIAQLREELPDVPVIALTASATPLVQQDICEKLSLGSDNRFKIFQQSFERPNLSYSVFNIESKINKIVSILNRVQGAAIIYCKSRKRTKEIAELLQAQGFAADFYHAGLSTEERNTKQQQWIENKIRIIVCTNAFGMGIDKPDVRVVIHADVPDCLENYYQEAGRAGRDGQRAYAVLLYNDNELEDLKQLPEIRYPSPETIRTVYSSVVNYLQLPEGEAPGESYDFILKDFVKKFGLDVQTTIYGLKALEQDGWLSFNEQVFSAATVCFSSYKDDLYHYENNHPEFEPLIKTLLRTYEGIYDYPVPISENYLAYLLRCDTTTVKEQLLRLHRDRIIVYEPQKEDPQVTLTRTRIKTSLLEINLEKHKERKTIFTERIYKILEYIHETVNCRSKIIGNYFGDHKISECGICDNCLRKRKTLVSQDLFEKITVLLSTYTRPVIVDELFETLRDYNKEHIWTVIDFLVDEGKIHLTSDGSISLMK